jgi:hypothetical protein
MDNGIDEYETPNTTPKLHVLASVRNGNRELD